MESLNQSVINPYIRVAQHSVLKAGRVIKQRILVDYELIFIEKGCFVLEYDGVEYNCKSGDYILIHPGVAHSFKEIYQPLSQPHIHFDLVFDEKSEIRFISFKDITDMDQSEKEMIPDDLLKDKKDPIISFDDSKLFFKVINASDNNSLKTKALMLEIIDKIIKNNYTGKFEIKNDSEKICKQIKDYIDAEQGYDASLADFEYQFSYNRFSIEKQFKSMYGVSVIAYKNEKRMEKAKNLLLTHSVTEVTEILGFSSIYSFSRAFKNRFGTSPNKYKKEAKQ